MAKLKSGTRIYGNAIVDSLLTVDGVGAFAVGSASAPSITLTGDTNTGLYSPGADQLAISTGGTERARIDSSGRFLVGTSTNISSLGSLIQSASTSTSNIFEVARFSASAFGPRLTFCKSRGASVGTNALVVDGDEIGSIYFNAANGSTYTNAARIEARVDGIPDGSLVDMPGRLVFLTCADGLGIPTERMVITSAGNVGIGTTNPDSKLHIIGGDLHLNSLDGTDVDIKLGVTASFNNFSIIRSTRISDLQSKLSFHLNNEGLKEMLRIDTYELIVKGPGDGTSVGDAGVILFSDQSEAPLARITCYKASTVTNDADLIFSTKSSGIPGTSEKMRISYTGAIGFNGENYGTAGQVLTSNGAASPPTWQSGGVDAIEVMLFG